MLNWVLKMVLTTLAPKIAVKMSINCRHLESLVMFAVTTVLKQCVADGTSSINLKQTPLLLIMSINMST